MENNICRFLPNRKNQNTLNIINLVYETECPYTAELKSIATYRLHYVTEGSGFVRTKNGNYPITAGDILIIPPALYFTIENTESIKYIYISFLGTKANSIAEQFKLNDSVRVFIGFKKLENLWKSLFESCEPLTDMCCEGVLLYTLSEIGKQIFPAETKKQINNVSEKIKIIIDEDFCNGNLTVENIADRLSYHPKYISAVFKKEFGIGINSYIKTLRLQQAMTLMEQGMTSIKDICAVCGFNDPLYFSNLFKNQFDITPKEHIKNIRQK